MAPFVSAVEKAVENLQSEINRLHKSREEAHANMGKIKKRRYNATEALHRFMGNPRPSNHVRSFRARVKMSKKTYAAVMKKVKWHFAEQYAKKKHQLKTDMTDTFKQMYMVNRYIVAMDEKIDALFDELSNELNSDGWNSVIHNKKLMLDNASGRSGRSQAYSPARGRGASAQPKSKRGRAGSAGRGSSRPVQQEADGDATPPQSENIALHNFDQIQIKLFKGPWAVRCGAMMAEATVNLDGSFSMQQKADRDGQSGWSTRGCKISMDRKERTFFTEIDNSKWRMSQADMTADAGKSVVCWVSDGKPKSIWTRTKKEKPLTSPPNPLTPDVPGTTPSKMPSSAPPANNFTSVAKAKPGARAKTQARTNAPAPTTPPLSAATGVGTLAAVAAPPAGPPAGRRPSSATGPAGAGPGAQPAEWYTEIRDGRLMWTDGISAVPAEERVTDENRQKTKMQF